MVTLSLKAVQHALPPDAAPLRFAAQVKRRTLGGFNRYAMSKGVLGVGLAMLFLVMIDCGADPEVQLAELSRNTVVQDEIVHLNNCGGKGDSWHEAKREFKTNVTIGGSVSFSSVVEGNISSKYSEYRSMSKKLTVVAPPGTNMEFVLRWSVHVRAGNVKVNGKIGTYEVSIPVSVELISSKDLGCEATELGPQSSKRPQFDPGLIETAYIDTNTAPQTQVAQPHALIKTNVPLPTLPLLPNIPSDTKPNSILDVGQSWWQAQMELVLVHANLRASDRNLQPSGWYREDEYFPKGINRGGVDIMFRLTSYKSQAVKIRYTLKNVSAKDNFGNKLTVFCWKYNGFPDYYHGAVECNTYEEVLSPGETIDLLGDKRNDVKQPWMTIVADVEDPSLQEIIVTVSDIAGIKSARWRIPIQH